MFLILVGIHVPRSSFKGAHCKVMANCDLKKGTGKYMINGVLNLLYHEKLPCSFIYIRGIGTNYMTA